MNDSRIAPTNPADYRYAVHCCSYKLGLSSGPDHAVALFPQPAGAIRFGASMWPSTFDVIDITTGESVRGKP